MSKKTATRALSVLLSLLLVLFTVPAGLFAAAEPAYWDGSTDTGWYNAQDMSFSISSASGLAGLASLVNGGTNFDGKIITLTDDIHLNDATGTRAWTPIGASGTEFKGTFNGGGFTVSGVYISGSAEYVGLFGKADYATFRGLDVDVSVKGGDNAGAIVGYATYCTFEGCATAGSVSGAQKSGGFAGSALNCSFSGCTNACTVGGTTYVGGIAGYGIRNTVLNCANSGTVTASADDAGGIIGYAVGNASVDSTIIACSNSGNISAKNYGGGIVGLAKGYTGASAGNVIINDCFNTGNVNASTASAGGIVGKCEAYTQLSCCYNSGTVTATSTTTKGGVVGSSTASVGNSSANCFYLSTSCNRDALGATSRTAANMTAVNTYSAYGKYVSVADLAVNARNVWIVNSGSYPQLYWQIQQTCSHSYPAVANETQPATCGAAGYNTFICTICGYVDTQEVAATGLHSYEVTYTEQATCAATGYNTYTCTVCGDTYDEEIAKSSIHTYEYIAGDNCLRCSVCGDEKTSVNGVCGDNATWTLDITDGNNILTIDGSGAMYDFSSGSAWSEYQALIKTVVFTGAGVSNISSGAFNGALSLTSVTIPASVTSIDANAFSGCGLVEIVIPATVTSIAAGAFAGCASLTSVTINSLTCDVDTGFVGGSASAFVYAYCNASFYSACKSAGVRISSLGNHSWIEATCKAAKHCSVCGATEGEKAAHTYTVIRYYSTQYHTTYCSFCGAASGEYVAHSGGTATCNDYAVCTECTEAYGEKLEHVYTLKTNATQHWYECTLCGDAYGYADHSGGTATCTEYAVCTLCGIEYGTVSGHDTTILQSNATEHWYKCRNCDYTTEPTAHLGGTATCSRKAVCEACGESYGELNASNHYDTINGAAYVTYTDETTVVPSTCTTAGYTGDVCCFGCKAKIADGEQTAMLGHTGGTATCTQKAICITCFEEYGELAEHTYNTARWITDGTNHWHKCSNPDCTAISDLAVHSGGTATCRAAANCAVCAVAYGTKNADEHVGGTFVKDQLDATCKQAGYTGDTVCRGCGVITQAGTVIQMLEHTGGTATCISAAVCDDCGEPYGALNASNHVGGTFVDTATARASTCTAQGYEGDICCSGCRIKLADGDAIAMKSHSGGTATCSSRAVCDECGNEYGAFNPENHAGNATTTINAKAKTCTEDGYTGDTVCEGCNRVFEYGQAIPFTGHSLSNVSGSAENITWTASVCSGCDYAVTSVSLHIVYKNGEAGASKAATFTGNGVNASLTSDASGNIVLAELQGGATYTFKTTDNLYTAVITIDAEGVPSAQITTVEQGEEPTEPTTEDEGQGGEAGGDEDDSNRSFLDLLRRFFELIKNFLLKLFGIVK